MTLSTAPPRAMFVLEVLPTYLQVRSPTCHRPLPCCHHHPHPQDCRVSIFPQESTKKPKCLKIQRGHIIPLTQNLPLPTPFPVILKIKSPSLLWPINTCMTQPHPLCHLIILYDPPFFTSFIAGSVSHQACFCPRPFAQTIPSAFL